MLQCQSPTLVKAYPHIYCESQLKVHGLLDGQIQYHPIRKKGKITVLCLMFMSYVCRLILTITNNVYDMHVCTEHTEVV